VADYPVWSTYSAVRFSGVSKAVGVGRFFTSGPLVHRIWIQAKQIKAAVVRRLLTLSQRRCPHCTSETLPFVKVIFKSLYT
jgi:hypothetical protein